MSVILFTKGEVYQDMANAYEGLKHLLRPYEEVDDDKFYKSMRRLYFANVAAYLCQYHDDTPLSKEELTEVDPFMELEGVHDPSKKIIELVYRFNEAWGSLQYNLTTNDGERYTPKEAYEYIDYLAKTFSEKVLETLK